MTARILHLDIANCDCIEVNAFAEGEVVACPKWCDRVVVCSGAHRQASARRTADGWFFVCVVRLGPGCISSIVFILDERICVFRIALCSCLLHLCRTCWNSFGSQVPSSSPKCCFS